MKPYSRILSLYLSVIVLFLTLFINPFYVLVILFILNNFIYLRTNLINLPISISLSLFFMNRELGVTWGNSLDDVPTYVIRFYQYGSYEIENIYISYLNDGISFEPIYIIFIYIVYALTQSAVIFIFLNYFAIFYLSIRLTNMIDKKNQYTVLLWFWFSIMNFGMEFHIWRHQIALILSLISLYKILEHENRRYILILVLSIFIHYSVSIFLLAYILYSYVGIEWFRKRDKIIKIMFSILLVIPIVLVADILALLVFSYQINEHVDIGYFSRNFYILGIFVLIMGVFVNRRANDFDNILLISLFMCMYLMITFNNVTSMYTRYLLTSIPLMSLCLYRLFYNGNFFSLELNSLGKYISILLITLVPIRYYNSSLSDLEVIRFLNDYKPLEIFSGIIFQIFKNI
jgi:hypothetical protein